MGTYDQWKDPTPYGDDPEECDCETWDYVDRMLGRVQCVECGRSWYLTDEQQAKQDRFEAEAERAYDEYLTQNGVCVKCGNDHDALPGAHVCGPPEFEMSDDELPF